MQPLLESLSNFVQAPQAGDDSEYGQLIALISTVVEDLSLVELTDEDFVFLINELGLEQQPEIQHNIEWLRRSALLVQETELPIEAFYGWGRKDVPAALAAVSLKEMPKVLEIFTGFREVLLCDVLLAAIEEKIIPASLRTRVDEIVRQLLRIDQLLHEEVAQLFETETGSVLINYRTTAFEHDVLDESRGLDITNNDYKFSVSFYASRNLSQGEQL